MKEYQAKCLPPTNNEGLATISNDIDDYRNHLESIHQVRDPKIRNHRICTITLVNLALSVYYYESCDLQSLFRNVHPPPVNTYTPRRDQQSPGEFVAKVGLAKLRGVKLVADGFECLDML